jgi:hypothetical protein
MRLLPKLNEFVEMLRGYLQDMLYVAATGVSWPYGIAAACLSNFSARAAAKFYDNLSLCIEPVHMARLVVFRIRNKSNTVKPNRAHANRILPKSARLAFRPRPVLDRGRR